MASVFVVGTIALFVTALLIDVISRRLNYLSQLTYKLHPDSTHVFVKKYAEKTRDELSENDADDNKDSNKQPISPLLFFLGSVLPFFMTLVVALLALNSLLEYTRVRFEVFGESSFICDFFSCRWTLLCLFSLLYIFLTLCLRRLLNRGFGN